MGFLNLFTKKLDQASITAILLKKLLKIPVSKTSLIEVISNHPDNPSFYSLSQGLSSFGIDSEAIFISNENINRAPVPFVAHKLLNKREYTFVIVTDVLFDQIRYLELNGRVKHLSIKSFFDVWTKNILFISSYDKAYDKNYKSNIKKERFSILLKSISIFIFLSIVYIKMNLLTVEKLHYFLLLVSFLIGFLICLLILSIEISENNIVAVNFCKGNGKMNCNNIITSDRSKLFGLVSLGDIGFAYFFSGILSLIYTDDFSNLIFLYNFLILVCFGFIPISIFIQRTIFKSWCIYCLIIMAIFVIQFLITISFNFHNFPSLIFNLKSISITSLVLYSNSILISTFLIYFVKPKFVSFVKYKTAKKEIINFKYNPNTFERILLSQTKVQSPIDKIGLFIGNKSANTQITIVTNPYCKPCSNAHLALKNIFENNTNISINIIFSATNLESDKRQYPSKCFLWIRDYVGENQAILQLEEWYNNDFKDYLKLMSENSIQDINEYNTEIDTMNLWCEKSLVTETPTVFINGFRLPYSYTIEDLNYFINHLDNLFSGNELGTSTNPSQFN